MISCEAESQFTWGKTSRIEMSNGEIQLDTETPKYSFLVTDRSNSQESSDGNSVSQHQPGFH